MRGPLLTRYTLALAAIWICLPTFVWSADEIQRIDQRYANETTTETPNFRQEVVPLLGKLGCNGRACHGSFQGRGGFRLSLFGYDFKADHAMLTQGEKPRVSLETPAQSLILLKPTETVDHEGGLRLKKDSWEYRVLSRWIESGAKPNESDTPEFVRLEVAPSEIVATKPGETFVLKITAVWSNGDRHDVTPLCRFRTNNDQIALIDDDGVVTSAGAGDSHVVVFYDNGVYPVPILQPISENIGANYPNIATTTKIDELVLNKLKKLGVDPSEICTDAEFLRRVTLDMTGTLPTPNEVESFLADNSTNKRPAKIEELLNRPGYAAWWATRFADWTGDNAAKLTFNNTGIDAATRANEWYEWLRIRIADNMPYDKLVEGLVLSASRFEGETFEQYSARMSGYYNPEPKGKVAEQPTMPHYWIRRDFIKPDDRALGFAYSFLGLRIQCAQCHKHPFDQWTKDDFDRFTGFFGRVRFGVAPSAKEEYSEMLTKASIEQKGVNANLVGKAIKEHLAKGEVMPFSELYLIPPKRPNKKNPKRPQVAGRTAKILGGDEVQIEELDDPRTALMDWLKDPSNPYFAKAIVNRVWSGYFNAGIVDPIDDLSLANPPSNEALLDYLCQEFRANGYDMKWLHRTIVNSDTYQRSWRTNPTNEHDERNFSHAVPHRLPAEVAYDAVQLATMNDQEAAKWCSSLDGRSIANAGVGVRGSRGRNDYALTIFGRSVRESNCDCDRSSEASLLQTVYLQNDNDVLNMIEGRGRWTDQVAKQLAKTQKPNGSAQPVEANERLAKANLKQLRKQLQMAAQKGKNNIVELIQAEIARREKAENTVASAQEPENAESNAAAILRVVTQAYLRTLSRYPSPQETERSLQYFEEVEDQSRATKDLLWALINTREFVLNH